MRLLNPSIQRAVLLLVSILALIGLVATNLQASVANESYARLLHHEGRRQCLANLTRNMVELTGSLITSGPIAYIDPPLHWNLGDSYIWAGAYVVLDQLGVSPSVTCTFYDYTKYSPKSVSTKCNETNLDLLFEDGGTIFFHGGGNFGDIYPALQVWRTEVVDRPALRKTRFVFLPQTVEYRDATVALEHMQILAAHPDVHIMVRCQSSFDYLRNVTSQFPPGADRSLMNRIYLVSDMALALGDLSVGHSYGSCPNGSTHDVLMLMRTDLEVASSVKKATNDAVAVLNASSHDYLHVDWFGFNRPDVRLPFFNPKMAFDLWPNDFRAAASARVSMGMGILCHGDVIVTDRLHALILGGLLMGKPVVFMDPAYAKLSRFIDTWIREDSQFGCLPKYFDITSIPKDTPKESEVPESQPVRAVKYALDVLKSMGQ